MKERCKRNFEEKSGRWRRTDVDKDHRVLCTANNSNFTSAFPEKNTNHQQQLSRDIRRVYQTLRLVSDTPTRPDTPTRSDLIAFRRNTSECCSWTTVQAFTSCRLRVASVILLYTIPAPKPTDARRHLKTNFHE